MVQNSTGTANAVNPYAGSNVGTTFVTNTYRQRQLRARHVVRPLPRKEKHARTRR